MDERTLEQKLAEELIGGWDITRTGSGYLVITDWRWPKDDRIEIYVRTVGERDDLYIVTDGGNLFNILLDQQVDLTKDVQGMKTLTRVAEKHGAKFVDYQLAKGATDADLSQAIRMVLEALKEASFLLWHKVDPGGSLH